MSRTPSFVFLICILFIPQSTLGTFNPKLLRRQDNIRKLDLIDVESYLNEESNNSLEESTVSQTKDTKSSKSNPSTKEEISQTIINSPKDNNEDEEITLQKPETVDQIADKKIEINRFNVEQKNYNKYISSTAIKVDCSTHLKYMEMNFTCLDDLPMIKTDSKSIFLVEHNFQKYLMKIRDKINPLEIALEKSMKNKGVVLSLLYHKVVRNRFIGIYKFEDFSSTLEEAVYTQKLSAYDKYSFMIKITKTVIRILNQRDPKSKSLDLNLLPSNILLLKTAPFSLNLIDIFASTMEEHKDLAIPDSTNLINYVDARTRNIFLLGRVFYFICFEEYLEYHQHSVVRDSLDEKDRERDLYDIDLDVLKLIRMMLNFSPVDRPSLEVVLGTLEGIINSSVYLHEFAKIHLQRTYLFMKHEVDYEYFAKQTQILEAEDSSGHSKAKNKIKQKTKEELMKEKTDKIFLNLSVNYKESTIKEIAKKLKTLGEEETNDLLKKVKSSSIRQAVNPSDRFKMIHDLTSLDLMPNLLETDSAEKDLLKLGTFDVFGQDLIDLEYIAEELIFSDFEYNKKKPILATIQNGRIFFSDRANLKHLNQGQTETITLVDLFLIYVQNEIYHQKLEDGIDEDYIRTSNQRLKRSENVEMDEFEFLESKIKMKESFFEKLSKLSWKYVMVMVFAQIMMILFTFLFLFRQTDLTKYDKKNFKSYIVF